MTSITQTKLKQLEKKDKICIGYARVSSQDDRQKLGLEVQLEALKTCDIVFTDKQSGSYDKREKLGN